MKRLLIVSFFSFIFSQNTSAIETIRSTILTSDSVSWDGGNFNYPGGNAKIIVQKITIIPDGKPLVISEHCHPIPLAAYVLKGNVRIEKKSGHYHIFGTGDAFIEVMNTWHKGEFTEHTELIAFYASNKDMPLSVKEDKTSQYSEKCK